uniref:Uncharacterized protein n=1 Tax=Rhizophora mucronata TaxID=61149 RepID=A0A2P2PPX4_RHIMU
MHCTFPSKDKKDESERNYLNIIKFDRKSEAIHGTSNAYQFAVCSQLQC